MILQNIYKTRQGYHHQSRTQHVPAMNSQELWWAQGHYYQNIVRWKDEKKSHPFHFANNHKHPQHSMLTSVWPPLQPRWEVSVHFCWLSPLLDEPLFEPLGRPTLQTSTHKLLQLKTKIRDLGLRILNFLFWNCRQGVLAFHETK